METGLQVSLIFGGMLILIFLGVPIAFALLLSGFFGLWAIGGITYPLETFRLAPYAVLSTYTMAAGPLFILMGEIADQSGATHMAFQTARAWLGRIRGGIMLAMIGAGALFGACAGSSIAGAVVLSKLAYPEMRDAKYDIGLSTGAIAIAGSLAVLIPPSVMMVFYGIITGESIGKLLIAGIFPGAGLTIALIVSVAVLAKLQPQKIPTVKAGEISWQERFRSLKNILPILFIFLLVTGGLFFGLFTPTQAGAIGALGTLIVLFVNKRKLAPKALWGSLGESINLSARIFFIVVAGMIFSRVVALTRAADLLMNQIAALGLAPYEVMGLVVVLYLILGCLMEPVSMLVITLPFIYPLMINLGFDGIAFGVIVVLLVEMAVITPPVGFNVFVVAAATGVPSGTIFRGAAPFYIPVLVIVVIIIFFPQIATFLPSLMI